MIIIIIMCVTYDFLCHWPVSIFDPHPDDLCYLLLNHDQTMTFRFCLGAWDKDSVRLIIAANWVLIFPSSAKMLPSKWQLTVYSHPASAATGALTLRKDTIDLQMYCSDAHSKASKLTLGRSTSSSQVVIDRVANARGLIRDVCHWNP